MKIKLGSIAKVVYPLILGWSIFFLWRVSTIEQIVKPMYWPFLIGIILSLSILIGFFFFGGLFAVDSRKDKLKYLSLLAISFGASSIALIQYTDNSIYEGRYANLEDSIHYFNKNKNYLTSKPYAEFLQAKESLDVTKLKEYTKSIDNLISIDKNLSMTLVLVKETVTSFNINDKFNEINSDNFVSKTEYNAFRDYILEHSKGNERVALVMAH
jgi:hypothetical protein